MGIVWKLSEIIKHLVYNIYVTLNEGQDQYNQQYVMHCHVWGSHSLTVPNLMMMVFNSFRGITCEEKKFALQTKNGCRLMRWERWWKGGDKMMVMVMGRDIKDPISNINSNITTDNIVIMILWMVVWKTRPAWLFPLGFYLYHYHCHLSSVS